MSEAERVHVLSTIRRMDPPDACDALINIRPYLEKAGVVYVQLRNNWEELERQPTVPVNEFLDYLDAKVGKARDIGISCVAYKKCDGETILWCYYYPTSHAKLIERLTHLTLAYVGAKRIPYPCRGCQVRHREHFSEGCAGLEFIAQVIEFWMRRIGEVPVRYVMYEEY
ncbi:hypothetical protein B0H14DRAFT_2636732 [Mycena olivaceomarginata]|nr:hypothetical protein B0H14DRAFT_2636732 [Mycena olivaceomarginata]